MAERELLAEGREAEIYIQPDGTILKLMRNAGDITLAQREAAVCRLLGQQGHVAPTVHDVVTVDDRPGLVMDRIEGTDLLAALQRRPLSVLTAARVLAEVHAGIHDCAAPPQLPDLNDELSERIHAADPLPADLKQLALRVLDGLPRGDRLCHGDFHLGNILGSWSAPVAIDWGYASRGAPVADVARTELLHRVGALPPGTPAAFRALTRIGRRLLTERYLNVYQLRRTIDDSIDRWRFVHAAARLNEPIPEEQPVLLGLLEGSAGSIGAFAA